MCDRPITASVVVLHQTTVDQGSRPFRSGASYSEMETFAMSKNICMPDVTSGDDDQPITYRQIVVVIVVLAFAALLLWAGLAPAEAAWLTGTLAATAALLTRRLGRRG